MARYVIHYTLDGQRRWDFAQLEQGTVEEARAALIALHGEPQADSLQDIRVTKAL
jgi:hypothetical protein